MIIMPHRRRHLNAMYFFMLAENFYKFVWHLIANLQTNKSTVIRNHLIFVLTIAIFKKKTLNVCKDR